MSTKRKVCKECKIFVKGDECPLCHGKDLTTNWEGRIIITDANKSEIAQKLNLKIKGEYAIKAK